MIAEDYLYLAIPYSLNQELLQMKYQILLVLLSLFTLIACDDTKKNVNGESLDSGYNLVPEEMSPFKTPDLAMHELRGPVKTCKQISFTARVDKNGMYETELELPHGDYYLYSQDGLITQDDNYVYTYMDNGEIKRMKGIKDPSARGLMTRDDRGRITQVENVMMQGNDTEADFITHFTWEGDKLITVGNNFNNRMDLYTYIYDKNQFVTRCDYRYNEAEATTRTTTTYIYRDFDKYGSWIERWVKCVTTIFITAPITNENNTPLVNDSGSVIMEEKELETVVEYLIEKRIITYYK